MYPVEHTNMISGKPVMKFTGINSKEDVARLTNRELAVTRDGLVRLSSDEYYVFDLIGCKVIDQAQGTVGEVEDVRRYPANDIYLIKGTDGRMVMLPAVKAFVHSVDLQARLITIDRSGLYQPAEDEAER